MTKKPDMDCRKCVCNPYCDELPIRDCYTLRVVAEVIESERKKALRDLWNRAIRKHYDILDLGDLRELINEVKGANK